MQCEKKIGKFDSVIEKYADLASEINLEVDRDDIQELLVSHNQELTIDELIEMHAQELESLDPVQSEDRMTVGIEESLMYQLPEDAMVTDTNLRPVDGIRVLMPLNKGSQGFEDQSLSLIVVGYFSEGVLAQVWFSSLGRG
ncbi:hypothetical protein TNCV_3039351 [Trichonephila clavipes]|nr:hypothetical protein TNCV_3039351 [Trichonephila clavipes]